MCVYQVFKYSISWVVFNFVSVSLPLDFGLNQIRSDIDGVKSKVGLFSIYNPRSLLDTHLLYFKFEQPFGPVAQPSFQSQLAE